MRHLLPSLNALRAAEAVGRHGSVSSAARELNVTPGAISRQVALLEAHFDCSLFVRTQRGLVLSERGKQYFSEIGDAFDLIDHAGDRLVGKRDKAQLSVHTFGTFAAEWLLPRLSDFERRNPGISILLKARANRVDFNTDDADVGIVISSQAWTHVHYIELYTPQFLPVISRELFERSWNTTAPLKSAHDLMRVPLLHARARTFGWKNWFDAMGAPNILAAGGHHFENYSQVYAGIRQAAGVGLGQRLFLGDELLNGSLVAPFNEMITWRNGPYRLVWPKKRKIRPEIEAFRDWLLTTLRAAERRLLDGLPDLKLLNA